jgi:hypothetical protein
VPVIAKTRVPSVTGDGDDMFCLRSWWLPPPSGAFHSTAGPLRSTHQSDSELPSATLRKIESPQTIGVAPLHSGSGSRHAILACSVHLSGSPFSVLTPFNCGPRHCGQLSADSAATSMATSDIESHARFMWTDYQLSALSYQLTTLFSSQRIEYSPSERGAGRDR